MQDCFEILKRHLMFAIACSLRLLAAGLSKMRIERKEEFAIFRKRFKREHA